MKQRWMCDGTMWLWWSHLWLVTLNGTIWLPALKSSAVSHCVSTNFMFLKRYLEMGQCSISMYLARLKNTRSQAEDGAWLHWNGHHHIHQKLLSHTHFEPLISLSLWDCGRKLVYLEKNPPRLGENTLTLHRKMWSGSASRQRGSSSLC